MPKMSELSGWRKFNVKRPVVWATVVRELIDGLFHNWKLAYEYVALVWNGPHV